MRIEEFQQLELAERVDWIDSVAFEEVSAYDRQESKKLFKTIYDLDENTYIRKRAVEYISELTLLNIIRYDYTKDFLLEEIPDDVDVFIVNAKLKYLFVLFGSDEDAYNEIKRLSASSAPEVVAEANLRLGLVHLIYKSSGHSSLSLLRELEQAKFHFQLAFNSVENRIDANFFATVCDYVLALLGGNPSDSIKQYSKIRELFRRRTIWSWLPGTELLEYAFLKSLSYLNAIAHHAVNQLIWTDYKAEILLLKKYMNDLVLDRAVNTTFVKSYVDFSRNVAQPIISEYYINNLSACVLKIDALIANAQESEIEFKSFLIELKDQLDAAKEKKSSEGTESVVARLYRGFSKLSLARIEVDVSTLRNTGKTELHILSELALRYASEIDVNRVDFITGYKTSDEILREFSARIKSLLPNYPNDKFAVSFSILADLLRYQYQSLTIKKDSFAPLYDSSIKAEKVFQDHLYEKLISSPRAAYYNYETTGIVGASRIDIVYREQEFVFPVEVKKTEVQPDWDMIQADYLSQAQTYAHPYNQLGFLVVFDISEKKGRGPINDVRSLSEIIHMMPFYNIPDKNPDYVIALIIPGNKINPSQYTKYS